MAEAEKFSLSKFLGSFTQWLPWVKTLRYTIGIIAILFLLFTIYKAFFEKKNAQKITIGSGSTVNIKQGETQRKRFILFVEPYVDQSSNRKLGTGVRGGVRLEW
jgi:Ni,Fe-hydrogenase I cytochrome b subunit